MVEMALGVAEPSPLPSDRGVSGCRTWISQYQLPCLTGTLPLADLQPRSEVTTLAPLLICVKALRSDQSHLIPSGWEGMLPYTLVGR
jgi:hypothetical protein